MAEEERFGAARQAGHPLTQQDIDQLLQGGGATAARPPGPSAEVVPYNFLRPPRISKDRRVALESIYSRFALSLQRMLSSHLRTSMDVSCSVEQAPFSEYLLSIANPCAVFVFGLGAPGGAQGALDLSTALAFYIVDRVFGGPGEATRLERPLTPLERTVARGFAEKMLAGFREAWQDHLTLAPEITGFKSIPDTIGIASPEDNVLVAHLEVRSGQFSGVVAMCLPFLVLEGFPGEKPTNRGQGAKVAANPLQRSFIESTIRSAEVDLSVRFPTLRLTAREVAGLRPGQVIQTTQPIDSPIELHINGSRRFLGVLGQYRRMLGIKITNPVSDPLAGTAPRGSRGRIQ